MEKTTEITSKLYEYTMNLWPENKEINTTKISNKDILQIGNAINSIFGNIDKNLNIELPRIVVVGTQSSGKSSLLNGLLNMDLLPTGKTMVTKTPLNLQLNQSENSKIEVGNYNQGMWITHKTILITNPEPTIDEINKVRKEIETITNSIVGDNMCISSKPIYLRIYSPNIPNLSLIDLPGLTMVACTDKGQPKDIKDQIRNLVSSYIESQNTIILAVMQARNDLETDLGLDLIKEYDPSGERTIGILTKVDLMNIDNDISDYLLNSVSKDLQLKYGYYAVRNRTRENITIRESLAEEEDYFSSHQIYNNLELKHKTGTQNVGEKLSNILISHIKNSLPYVITQLSTHQEDLKKELKFLGYQIPNNTESQISYLHQLLSDLSRSFTDSIDNRGNNLNYGKKIKDIFINYRKTIIDIQPFEISKFGNNLIEEAISNSEGNHMSFPVPRVEVIEKCILHNDLKPIKLLLEPSLLCCAEINRLLLELVDNAIKNMNISRFPNLTKKIKEIFIEELLQKATENSNVKINEMIQIEEDYIWTDDENFLLQLQEGIKNLDKSSQSHLDFIRKIIKSYYASVCKNIQNTIPKVIMSFLVRECQNHINICLFKYISNDNIKELLVENSEIENKRKNIVNKIELINNAHHILSKHTDN